MIMIVAYWLLQACCVVVVVYSCVSYIYMSSMGRKGTGRGAFWILRIQVSDCVVCVSVCIMFAEVTISRRAIS